MYAVIPCDELLSSCDARRAFIEHAEQFRKLFELARADQAPVRWCYGTIRPAMGCLEAVVPKRARLTTSALVSFSAQGVALSAASA
jgi:hypothetical protein